MNQILAVLKKELLEGLRDKRSMSSALLFPLIGPVLLVVLLHFVVERHSELEPLELPVVGAEYAPNLVKFLREHEVILQTGPEKPKEAVQQGDLDVVLVIPEDYSEQFRSGRAAQVQVIEDESRQGSAIPRRRTRRLLAAYGAQIATLRLMARGVHPELIRTLDIEKVDISTPEKRAARMLEMLPMFVVLAAFICTMYIAIDVTAGERERGSLEPLMINPISRMKLTAGKWFAVLIFGFGGTLLTLIAAVVGIGWLPLENVGLRLALRETDVAWMAITAIPAVLMAGSLQMLVATFARSFREAQTYLSLLMFVPMVPGMVRSFSPMESQPWMFSVPILGQQMLISDLMKGEAINLAGFALASFSTLVVAVAAIAVTARLFEKEQILFGR